MSIFFDVVAMNIISNLFSWKNIRIYAISTQHRCLFYVSSRWNDFSTGTWVGRMQYLDERGNPLENPSDFLKYLTTLLNVLEALRTRTTGSCEPHQVYEFILAILLSVLGIFAIAWVTSTLSNLVFKADDLMIERNAKLKLLDSFCSRLQLSSEIRAELRQLVQGLGLDKELAESMDARNAAVKDANKRSDSKGSKGSKTGTATGEGGANNNQEAGFLRGFIDRALCGTQISAGERNFLLKDLNSKLPLETKTSIAQDMFDGKLMMFPFFSHRDHVFLWEVAPLLVLKMFSKNQTIYLEGDRPEGMFFVFSGKVNLYTQQEVRDVPQICDIMDANTNGVNNDFELESNSSKRIGMSRKARREEKRKNSTSRKMSGAGATGVDTPSDSDACPTPRVGGPVPGLPLAKALQIQREDSEVSVFMPNRLPTGAPINAFGNAGANTNGTGPTNSTLTTTGNNNFGQNLKPPSNTPHLQNMSRATSLSKSAEAKGQALHPALMAALSKESEASLKAQEEEIRQMEIQRQMQQARYVVSQTCLTGDHFGHEEIVGEIGPRNLSAVSKAAETETYFLSRLDLLKIESLFPEAMGELHDFDKPEDMSDFDIDISDSEYGDEYEPLVDAEPENGTTAAAVDKVDSIKIGNTSPRSNVRKDSRTGTMSNSTYLRIQKNTSFRSITGVKGENSFRGPVGRESSFRNPVNRETSFRNNTIGGSIYSGNRDQKDSRHPSVAISNISGNTGATGGNQSVSSPAAVSQSPGQQPPRRPSITIPASGNLGTHVPGERRNSVGASEKKKQEAAIIAAQKNVRRGSFKFTAEGDHNDYDDERADVKTVSSGPSDNNSLCGGAKDTKDVTSSEKTSNTSSEESSSEGSNAPLVWAMQESFAHETHKIQNRYGRASICAGRVSQPGMMGLQALALQSIAANKAASKENAVPSKESAATIGEDDLSQKPRSGPSFGPATAQQKPKLFKRAGSVLMDTTSEKHGLTTDVAKNLVRANFSKDANASPDFLAKNKLQSSVSSKKIAESVTTIMKSPSGYDVREIKQNIKQGLSKDPNSMVPKKPKELSKEEIKKRLLTGGLSLPGVNTAAGITSTTTGGSTSSAAAGQSPMSRQRRHSHFAATQNVSYRGLMDSSKAVSGANAGGPQRNASKISVKDVLSLKHDSYHINKIHQESKNNEDPWSNIIAALKQGNSSDGQGNQEDTDGIPTIKNRDSVNSIRNEDLDKAIMQSIASLPPKERLSQASVLSEMLGIEPPAAAVKPKFVGPRTIEEIRRTAENELVGIRNEASSSSSGDGNNNALDSSSSKGKDTKEDYTNLSDMEKLLGDIDYSSSPDNNTKASRIGDSIATANIALLKYQMQANALLESQVKEMAEQAINLEESQIEMRQEHSKALSQILYLVSSGRNAK